MSIRVNHNNRDFRVVFEYYDADGVRFKKRDNADQPASWHRHPRSCSAFLEVHEGAEFWRTVGFAASFAHDGENFDRAEGRLIALLRLINLLPDGALKGELFVESYRRSFSFTAFSCDLACTSLNVKGEQIDFWTDLDDEA